MRYKNETRIKFLHGERYYHYLVPYEKIEAETPTRPGLYSWHIRIRPGFEEITAEFLESAFQQRSLKASVSGNLRLNYEGTLYKTALTLKESEINEPLIQSLMMIPIPLYIGITNNLLDRLKRHKEKLNQVLLTGDNYFNGPPEGVESDTDEESTEFGLRLGNFWRQNNFFEPHSLYVRFLVPAWCDEPGRCACSDQCRVSTRRMLLEAEHACNTLFNPVFGRR